MGRIGTWSVILILKPLFMYENQKPLEDKLVHNLSCPLLPPALLFFSLHCWSLSHRVGLSSPFLILTPGKCVSRSMYPKPPQISLIGPLLETL